MKKLLSLFIIVLISGMTACATTKTANNESRNLASEETGKKEDPARNPGGVLGEVFLKGSIDGKNMFMVVGMKDAIEYSKEMIEHLALEKDLKQLGRDIYNKEHRDDAYDRYRDSIKVAENILPDLFKGPWKTIKKIPNAYKVNFERGQEAYYTTKNSVAGSLKYTGWAVWANVQGAYYLIIEAPAAAILASVAVPMVGAVPTAQEVLAVGWGSTKILMKLGLEVSGLLALNTYAFVTSSTATLMTAMTAGGIAVYKGTKWLVYGLPHRFGYPIAVELMTQFKADDQQLLAQKIVDLFEKDGIQKNIHLVSKIEKFKSKLVMMGENDDGSEVKMGEILVSVEKARVIVKVEFKRTYINLIVKNKGVSKAEAKQMLNDEAVALIEIINDKISK